MKSCVCCIHLLGLWIPFGGQIFSFMDLLTYGDNEKQVSVLSKEETGHYSNSL